MRVVLAAAVLAWGTVGMAETRGTASLRSGALQATEGTVALAASTQAPAAAPASAASAARDAQPAMDVPPAGPMEEVVVTGEHEGPRLWKVRKAGGSPSDGDHVLWILGTVTPLPKKMIWQSDAVEAVVEQSQEVVPAWPAFGIGANPFTALRVWMQWHKIQKNPDRMDLRQTLPPAT